MSRLKRVIMIGDHHQLPPVVKNMAMQVRWEWVERQARTSQEGGGQLGLLAQGTSGRTAEPLPPALSAFPIPVGGCRCAILTCSSHDYPPTPSSFDTHRRSTATWTSRCSPASSAWARPTSS